MIRTDGIGARAVGEPFAVTREATAAYAAATNDENAQHLNGDLAPPLFAIFPAQRTMASLARSAVTERFALHGEHDLRFMKPIVAGMTLTASAEIVGIRPIPPGTQIIVRSSTRDERGDVVCEQYLVTVVRGEKVPDALGIAPPDHRAPAGVVARPADAELVYPVTADQTLRYAEASGDRSPYTFDADAARAVGLAEPIVHGLCTMAFFSRAVVEAFCGNDSQRLRRLAVRFSGLMPMRGGQSLRTRLWRAAPGAGAFVVFGESDDVLGTTVLKHGYAEIASS